jgi:hypothetical protein
MTRSLPLAFETVDACVLGIDPGATSGWSVFVAGELVGSGTVHDPCGRAYAVDLARVVTVAPATS